MELIKENLEKQRAVYRKDEDTVRKIWYNRPFEWLDEHCWMLDQVNPGYAKKIGWEEDHVWMDMRFIEGRLASTFPHTTDFVYKIMDYVNKQYQTTMPYAHGDWVLSNIIINGDIIEMIDWDNLGKHPKFFVKRKIKSDLKSAFGGLYDEVLRSMA